MSNISKVKDLYLNQYIKYLQNPVDNAIPMSKMIASFENLSSLWSEDLFFECRKSKFHNITKKLFEYDVLETNGSTGIKSQKYKWGPNFHIIVNYIWDCMHRKHYNFNNRYWVCTGPKNKILHKTKMNEGIKLVINPKKAIDIQLQKSVLLMSPSTLSMMLKHSFFIDFIKRIKAIISITSSDSFYFDFSILKELNIPLINQMRSWKEGTAFYTCPYNTKHWIESLFYCTSNKRIFDLFNFHNQWWQNKDSNPDNIWPLENDFKQCQCGTWYREVNFQPHAVRHFYDCLGRPNDKLLLLSEKNFTGTYKNFQIIQRYNLKSFEIYTENNILKQDYEIIKKYIFKIYKSNNFELKTIRGKYSIGRNEKVPVFWSEYNGDYNEEDFFKQL